MSSLKKYYYLCPTCERELGYVMRESPPEVEHGLLCTTCHVETTEPEQPAEGEEQTQSTLSKFYSWITGQ